MAKPNRFGPPRSPVTILSPPCCLPVAVFALLAPCRSPVACLSLSCRSPVAPLSLPCRFPVAFLPPSCRYLVASCRFLLFPVDMLIFAICVFSNCSVICFSVSLQVED